MFKYFTVLFSKKKKRKSIIIFHFVRSILFNFINSIRFFLVIIHRNDEKKKKIEVSPRIIDFWEGGRRGGWIGSLDDEALSSRFHGSLKRFSTVFSPVFRSYPPSNAILTRHKLGHIVLPDAWRLAQGSVPLNALPTLDSLYKSTPIDSCHFRSAKSTPYVMPLMDRGGRGRGSSRFATLGLLSFYLRVKEQPRFA